jgi:hypothetical protein
LTRSFSNTNPNTHHPQASPNLKPHATPNPPAASTGSQTNALSARIGRQILTSSPVATVTTLAAPTSRRRTSGIPSTRLGPTGTSAQICSTSVPSTRASASWLRGRFARYWRISMPRLCLRLIRRRICRWGSRESGGRLVPEFVDGWGSSCLIWCESCLLFISQ